MPPQAYRSSFADYLAAVSEKHNLTINLAAEADIINDHNETKVTAAVCMRAMCAAVTESLIVLDRWLYIQENFNGYIGLHRPFEETVSPRGWTIVAIRLN